MESSENANGYTLPVEATNIVNELLLCLQSRFEDMHENPLFLAGQIFDHKNWPGFGGEEALMLYGKDEIKTITVHFRNFLRMPNATWICYSVNGMT